MNETQTETKESCSIYVGNVPWKATPEDISLLIASKANVKVKDVRIVKEKGTGRSRGFAFVDIYHDDPENFIKQAPELVLEGRTLTIKYANERKPKEDVLSPVTFSENIPH